jgi:hypothetical protein
MTSRPPRLDILIIALLLVAVAWDRTRILAEFASKYTDQDQTLLWYTAREVAQGRWHEPAFYGQAYNPPVEAWLAAPLVAAGSAPWVALPMVTMLLGLAPYLVLAAAAWWRKSRYAAAAVLAIPLILPAEYAMITSMPRGFVAGIAVASVACAMWLHARARWAPAVAAAIAVLSITLLPNALLLVVPVALYALLTRSRQSAFRIASALGLLAAAPLPLGLAWFYARHPERVVHHPTPLAFSFQHLGRAFSDLSIPLGHFSPLVNVGWPVLAVMLLLVVAVWRLGDGRMALAGGAGLLCLIAALGVTRVELEMHSVFFPASRYYLAAPVLVAVLLMWCLGLAEQSPAFAGRVKAVAIALTIAALAMVVIRQAKLEDRVGQATQRTYPLYVAQVDELRVVAQEIARTAQQCHADLLIVSSFDQLILPYSVPVLTDGAVETLFPPYERRSWRVRDESSRHRDRVLVLTGGMPHIDERLRSSAFKAELVSQLPGLWCVQTGGRTAMQLAEQIGIEVRAATQPVAR